MVAVARMAGMSAVAGVIGAPLVAVVPGIDLGAVRVVGRCRRCRWMVVVRVHEVEDIPP